MPLFLRFLHIFLFGYLAKYFPTIFYIRKHNPNWAYTKVQLCMESQCSMLIFI